MEKVTVLGAGSWGIALANHYRRLGHGVTLWGRDPQTLEQVAARGTAEKFFPNLGGEQGIAVTRDLGDAVAGAALVVIALPSSAFRGTLAHCSPDESSVLVSASKGLETDTDYRMSEVLQSLFPAATVCVLTGPSFAVEVVQNLPTAVAIAGNDPVGVERAMRLTQGQRLRVYPTDDLIGAELGGTLKNVLAIAAGVVDGAQLGVNARAALLTRGLAELRRLVVAAGGRAETVMGLSGMGDLLLTATSDLSRNRRVGLALGSGGRLDSALQQIGQTAEGVQSARQVVDLGRRYSVELPISEEVLNLLEGRRANVMESVKALFSRAPTRE